MSVESGLGAPVEKRAGGREAASAPPSREPLITRRPPRERRAERQPFDVLADAVSLPAFRGRGDRPRPQGRRVRRVVRRIELWSVLKISLVFNVVMLGIALGSVALLWGLATTTGLVDDLEGFLRDSGFEDFRFQGDRMFRQVAFIGAVGALAVSVFTVLATALVNLISELTGGIRVVVIEEIVDRGEPRTSPPTDVPVVPARERPRSALPDVDPPRPTGPRGPSSHPPSAGPPVGPPATWPGSGPAPTPVPDTEGTGTPTAPR